MKRDVLKKTILALVLAGAAAGASAHRPWMLPSSTMVEGKQPWVTIDGGISEGLFDVDHMPLRMEAVTVTSPDGSVAPAPAPYTGKLRSSIDLQLPQDGSYRVSLVSANVMASYKLNGEVKRFRGTEQNFAKELPAGAQEVRATRTLARIETFVSANTPSEGALKPSGVGLEMVPLTNPTDLRTGETARWRFQLDGKALPNFPFSLVPGGVRYRGVLGEIRIVTDAKGEASVKLPTANMYWVNATYPAAQAKGAPGEAAPEGRRFSYTATIEVLPE